MQNELGEHGQWNPCPEYLKLAREVAEGIGRIVSENLPDMREMGEKAFTGAYGVPTARIDALAEKRALEIIESSGLELNVLTEERGFIERGAAETLILDPIDGTINCVSGIPFYAVSVAFAGGGGGGIGARLSDVFLGHVKNLPAGEEYIAAKGKGARLRTCGREIVLQPGNAPPLDMGRLRASVYLGSFVEPPSFLCRIRYLRSLGAASLEMCLVARGALDFYYFNSTPERRLRIVDVAAAALIVRESCGCVLDEDGNDLKMNVDLEDRKNLVAARDKKALQILDEQSVVSGQMSSEAMVDSIEENARVIGEQ